MTDAISPPSISPAAERMRRHRQRRRDGLRCLNVELRETEIDTLIGRRLLNAKRVTIRARSWRRCMRSSIAR